MWEHIPAKINVKPPHDGRGGLANLTRDIIDIYWPINPSYFQIVGHSYIISHELAHHFVSEYFDDTLEGRRLAINLVHFEDNLGGGVYRYSRRYWAPTMWKRVGLNGLSITMLDVKRLIDDRDYIMGEIRKGTAPHGRADYSI